MVVEMEASGWISYGIEALSLVVIVGGTVWGTVHRMFRDRFESLEDEVDDIREFARKAERVDQLEEDMDSLGDTVRDLRIHIHKEIASAQQSLGEQVGRLQGRLESVCENQKEIREDIAVLRDRSDRDEDRDR